MKTCTKCRKERFLSDFSVDDTKSDGLYSSCKLCRIIEQKRYYECHKKKINEKHLQYRKSNRKKAIDYMRRRRSEDILLHLSDVIRGRLYHALKNNQKCGSAVKDLGCSIGDLKNFLEKNFKSGMTWENYGRNGWHIDHIIPLSSFDLSDRNQFLKACHYTNLQPLWAKENISKGKKILGI